MRATGSRMVRPTRAVIRVRSSAAAFRLKVRTSRRSGSAPASIRVATASTIVVVFPVPGPARTSSGPPRWSTTACCVGSSCGRTNGATSGCTSRYTGACWLTVAVAVSPRTPR